MKLEHVVFIPRASERGETARWLTKLARDNDISQKSIRSISGGFLITEDLADLVYEDAEQLEEADETPAPAPAATGSKKTSGKAAKNDSKEGS